MVVLSLRVNCTVSVSGEEVYPSFWLFFIALLTYLPDSCHWKTIIFSCLIIIFLFPWGLPAANFNSHFSLWVFCHEPLHRWKTYICLVFVSEIILKCNNQNLIFFARPIKTSTACACDFWAYIIYAICLWCSLLAGYLWRSSCCHWNMQISDSYFDAARKLDFVMLVCYSI